MNKCIFKLFASKTPAVDTFRLGDRTNDYLIVRDNVQRNSFCLVSSFSAFAMYN
jgi:hypothetical protein